MNLLPKPLRSEIFYYTSDKSAEDLRWAAQQLIEDSDTLIGKFFSENEFYLYPRYLKGWRRSFFPAKESSGSLLKGEIYTDEYTCLKISVKPSNSLLLSFSLFFFGSTFFVILFFNSTRDIWLPPFLSPILIVLFSYLLKKWIRNKVVNQLGLKRKAERYD